MSRQRRVVITPGDGEGSKEANGEASESHPVENPAETATENRAEGPPANPQETTAEPEESRERSGVSEADAASLIARDADTTSTHGPTREDILRAIGEDPRERSEAVTQPVATAEKEPTESMGFGGFGTFDPSMFATTTQGSTDTKEPKSKKSKNASHGLTDEERAAGAVIGGGFIRKGLNAFAKWAKSNVTVESLSKELTTPFIAKAQEFGVNLPSGIPIDIIDMETAGSDEFPLVQKLSVVLQCREVKGEYRMLPIRYALGVTKFREGETPMTDPQHPQPGQCAIAVMDADIANAIAANAMSTPTEKFKKLMAYLEEHQDTIRLIYAGTLTVGFGVIAVMRREKTV